MRARSVAMAATASLALVLSSIAVQTGPGNPPAQAADELPAFRDCAELEAWYRAAALPLVGPFGLASVDDGHGTFAVAVRAESRTVAAAPGATGAQDAVGSNDRGTNVQEAEVDESDLVKTDGRFVYVASSGRLVVLDTAGGRLVRTARLALRDTPRELLLEGSRVLVVGNVERGIEKPQLTDGRRPVDGQRPMPGPRTTLALVDVSTPQAPRLLGSEEIDGRYVSARLTGGVARVVLASQPRLRFPAPRVLDYATPEAPSVDGTGMPHRGPDGGRHFKLDDLIRMNKKTVAASTAADWLPQRVRRDGRGKVVSNGPLLDCSQVRHPRNVSSVSTLSVLTIDLAGQDALDKRTATAITGAGDTVYASTERLYVATSAFSQVVAEPLSDEGSAGSRPYRTADPTSQVHAFATSGRSTVYEASGTVAGIVPGQWGFSEHEGRLRVVSTTGQFSGDGTGTRTGVSVLERRGDRLVRVGFVDGLGKQERVYAVRWFGDVGVVVTFRQTDPLYTLDLSDPRRPTVAGELKIPGYSGYLHPVGDDILLGIGQDADASTGRRLGMQASLFDLTDVAKPRRVAQVRVGRADNRQALVEHDSRAFTYLADAKTALVPTMTSSGNRLVALHVGADRTLRVGPDVAAGGTVIRAVPVGRLVVALGEPGFGATAALLDPADKLRTLDTVTLK